MADRFLLTHIGNGKKASFWYDSWTSSGPLIKDVGVADPRSFRMPLNAIVSAACNTDGWTLPPPWSEVALNLHMHLTQSFYQVSLTLMTLLVGLWRM